MSTLKWHFLSEKTMNYEPNKLNTLNKWEVVYAVGMSQAVFFVRATELKPHKYIQV